MADDNLLTPSGDAEGRARITKDSYPEIIQAIRWSDEDNGTEHFEPGVGFVVDDPDGVSLPVRWLPHLDEIEKALAGLDHQAPHPLDVDVIEWLAREGKSPTIDESAAYCFVCGEHTPVMAMANSTPELWVANRFLNEYFEGWAFDPSAGFEAALTPPPAPTEAAGLRAAAIKARDQFAFYASEHTNAGKVEKAATNQAFADLLTAALAKSPPAAVGVDEVLSVLRQYDPTLYGEEKWEITLANIELLIRTVKRPSPATMEALRPFAEAAENWAEMGDTRPVDEDGKITVGDLRRAASVCDTAPKPLGDVRERVAERAAELLRRTKETLSPGRVVGESEVSWLLGEARFLASTSLAAPAVPDREGIIEECAGEDDRGSRALVDLIVDPYLKARVGRVCQQRDDAINAMSVAQSDAYRMQQDAAKVALEYRGPPPLRHAATCRGIAAAILALKPGSQS